MQVRRVQPALRGERSCLCTGVLHETKGHYGWILPEQAIDHAEAFKHHGGVYLDTRDIRRGAKLCKGDEVMFYLYADSNGLGAEDCHLKTTTAPSTNFKPTIALNLSDILDLEDRNKKVVASKKLECEVTSDTASTASGTRSGSGSGSSTPRSSTSDFENDPVLRLLLQPRVRKGRNSMTPPGSPPICSRQASPERTVRHHELEQPEIRRESDVIGFSATLRAELEDADVFAMLRAELAEARARAGQLAKKLEEPGFVAPPPGLEDATAKYPPTATLPLGFKPPPGLEAMVPSESMTPSRQQPVDDPAELEAPPGLAPPKVSGFMGWCLRMRMPRFKEACAELM